MASIGTIKQFKGPFDPNESLDIDVNSHCKIGISIGEDDYMLLGSTSSNSSLRFLINNEQIWMGRTYVYETGEQVKYAEVVFPDGAPISTIVDIVYCKSYD